MGRQSRFWRFYFRSRQNLIARVKVIASQMWDVYSPKIHKILTVPLQTPWSLLFHNKFHVHRCHKTSTAELMKYRPADNPAVSSDDNSSNSVNADGVRELTVRPWDGGEVGMTGANGRTSDGSQAPANTSSMWFCKYLHRYRQTDKHWHATECLAVRFSFWFIF